MESVLILFGQSFIAFCLIASALLLMRQKAVCVIAQRVKLSRSRDGICMLKVSFNWFHCLKIPHLVLFNPTNLLCPSGNISDPAVSCKYILRANSSGPWRRMRCPWCRMLHSPYLCIIKAVPSCLNTLPVLCSCSVLQSATSSLSYIC